MLMQYAIGLKLRLRLLGYEPTNLPTLDGSGAGVGFLAGDVSSM